jgi:ABC-2 type transport system permease protein
MNSQTLAILRAQWRMLINFYRRHGRVTLILSTLFSAIWYGGFAGIAVFLAGFMSQPSSLPAMNKAMHFIFFAGFAYWQGMPLLMASVGGLLDLKKIVVYPVEERSLYGTELLLRTIVFLEMPLVMLGMTIGLLRNPALPKTAVLAPILFTLMNITLGAGIKDMMTRLLQKKRVREAVFLVVVLVAALPSLLAANRGGPRQIGAFLARISVDWLPWVAAARISLGGAQPVMWMSLIGFALLGWWFGRWQFHKSLWFDAAAQKSSDTAKSSGRLNWMLGWPNLVFRDPLAALVEKELRFLSRVSRFRIVFAMGFTFGLVIWLPMVFGRAASSGGWMSQNFLTVVIGYAVLLLSEVTFYNAFGFERGAAQMYFLTPVRPALVLIAKNIAAVFFVVLEVAAVTSVCLLLRLPITGAKVLEAILVAAILMLFMLGVGNIGSTRSPRPQNPNDGFRRTAGSKFALLAALLYPVIAVPIGLAYLGRWAFQSELAFYACIGAGILVAACFYSVALETGVETLDRDREKFVNLLGQGDAPAL